MTAHWATDFIGLPYSAGATGPEAFDCRGLVQQVVRQRLGTELPTVEQVHSSGWHPVDDAPREMDIVLMDSITGKHIGVMVQADGQLGCLHAEHSSGVVFQRLGDVLADGYHQHKLWRYDPSRGPGATLMDIADFQDKEAQRGLLQVIALVLVAFSGPLGLTAGQAAAAAFALNVASSVLIPIEAPKTPEQAAASPTYNTSLGGNQARLDQPIPRICGRHKVTPPFAAQPYMEYNDNNEQFYYALLAVGIGNHVIERALIDDTPMSHFQDVLTSTYLPPGTLPTAVLTNVSTAPEVAGQDMVPGLYIGGFAACAPRKLCTQIGIDIVAPRGLGTSESDGTLSGYTVTWRVEIREINEFGSAVTPWSVLASESRSASTNTPQRWSYRYTLATPIRAEIRVGRTSVRSENLRVLNDIQWSGMRAYLDDDAPLNPDTAHYEVVLRASEQLSGLSQRNISLIVQAMVRTWHPDTGWGAEVHTRNPAWWLADLWTNAVWGEGLPDNRVDLQTLYELSLVWEARQDRFDFVFDTTMDAWEAAQMIARCGRARAFRRGAVHTLARDSVVTLPVTAFTPRNTIPDSMVMSEALPTRDAADGIIIEYFDNRSWAWAPIECPMPGVDEMVNPVRKRMAGVTGPIQAKREGLYEAASLLYRRRTVKCTTEMQGMLPAFMSAIRWQPEILGYGQSGDVVSWDPNTLTMGLSEPVIWGDSPNYLTLIRKDGSLTHSVHVLPGPNETDVVHDGGAYYAEISAVVDNITTPPLDTPTRERPKYILGPLDTCDELVKINVISDGGKGDGGVQLFDIEAVVDDARVHAADNAYLPGPGDVQDPIDTSDEVDEGSTFSVAAINTQYYTVIGLGGPGAIPEVTSTLRFGNDGRLEYLISGNHAVEIPSPGFRDGEWISNAPIEVADAALFEIRFTTMSLFVSEGASTVGDMDTWLSMGTERSISAITPEFQRVEWTVHVELRNVDSPLVIQAAANLTLFINNENTAGGD